MQMNKDQGAGMRMDPEMYGQPAATPGQMPPWLARANAGIRSNMGMEPGNPGSRIPGPPQPGTPMAAGAPPPIMPQSGGPAGMQNPQLPQLIAQLMAKSGGRVPRGV